MENEKKELEKGMGGFGRIRGRGMGRGRWCRVVGVEKEGRGKKKDRMARQLQSMMLFRECVLKEGDDGEGERILRRGSKRMRRSTVQFCAVQQPRKLDVGSGEE